MIRNPTRVWLLRTWLNTPLHNLNILGIFFDVIKKISSSIEHSENSLDNGGEEDFFKKESQFLLDPLSQYTHSCLRDSLSHSQ